MISIQYSVIGNSVGVIVMWILGGDKGTGKGGGIGEKGGFGSFEILRFPFAIQESGLIVHALRETAPSPLVFEPALLFEEDGDSPQR